MENQNFIYAVFRTRADYCKALESLGQSGLGDVSVIRDSTAALEYRSATVASRFQYFKIAGAIGAVIGGLAGTLASPTVPYAGSFQVLTPIMAAVSGAVLSAYFGVWICGFLHGIEKPWIQTDMFQGRIENGSLLIAVTTESREQKLLAIECLEKNDAVELVIRAEEAGPLEMMKPVAVESGSSLPAAIELVA